MKEHKNGLEKRYCDEYYKIKKFDPYYMDKNIYIEVSALSSEPIFKVLPTLDDFRKQAEIFNESFVTPIANAIYYQSQIARAEREYAEAKIKECDDKFEKFVMEHLSSSKRIKLQFWGNDITNIMYQILKEIGKRAGIELINRWGALEYMVDGNKIEIDTIVFYRPNEKLCSMLDEYIKLCTASVKEVK